MGHAIYKLAAGVAVIALSGSPAYGQETREQETKVGEIVVTAQRREERLRDVPIAITAVTAERLEAAGVSGTTALSTITPGLNIPLNGGYAQPVIRGIGTSSTSPGVEPSAPIYVDGVYSPNQAASVFEFNNISRVEVLKGPQGTLFGRNATAGAINITTMQPSDTFVARLGASYGSYKEIKLNGYVSGRLADGISADLAAIYRDDAGYARDIILRKRTAKIEDVAVRGKLRLHPTENLDLTLAANYGNRIDQTGYALKPVGERSSVPNAIYSADPREIALSFIGFLKTRTAGTSLRGVYDAPSATFTSITAYQEVTAYLITDIDRTNLPVSSSAPFVNERTFTQELRVRLETHG